MNPLRPNSPRLGPISGARGVARVVRGRGVRAGGGGAGGEGGAGGAEDGRLLLAAAGGAVRLFDTRTRAPLTTLWSSGATGACPASRGAGGEVAVTALALASPPHRLFTAAGDKLRLWDLRMLECVCKVWSGHAAAVMCLALGRAGLGALVVTGSKDHYVRTLDLHTLDTGGCEPSGRRLLEPPHYDGVQALALCGDVLYSASRDTSIKRWSLSENTLTHTAMNAHKGWVTGVCPIGVPPDPLSPAAPAIASCGRDGALRVWNSGLRALATAPMTDAAHALRPHPDPRRMTLYTAGNGGDVRAWRLVRDQ